MTDPVVVAVMVRFRVMKNNLVFDSVPQSSMLSYPGGNTPETERMMNEKIFFQTQRGITLGTLAGLIPGNNGDYPLEFEWTALECPDPRFNHNVGNWFLANPADYDVGTLFQQVSTFAKTELMGKDGRDNGIFMSVSGMGEMLSPGELGFIIRPYDDNAANSASFDFLGRTPDSVDWTNPTSDHYNFFRTVRLYDHGEDHKADKVFENFEYLDDSAPASQRVRVNPLSDLPVVLEAAINGVPYDYRVAKENETEAGRAQNMGKDYTTYLGNNWGMFASAWVDHVTNAVNAGRVYELKEQNIGGNNKAVKIADVYGKWASSVFPASALYPTVRHWYSERVDETKILGVDVSKPLYEADRKMLYSFSMDAFSDRQQLFLYILQAETMVPGVGSETRSLAGGRAVALVWRDAYPQDYPSAMNLPLGDRRHEQRVLFFKQLDQ